MVLLKPKATSDVDPTVHEHVKVDAAILCELNHTDPMPEHFAEKTAPHVAKTATCFLNPEVTAECEEQYANIVDPDGLDKMRTVFPEGCNGSKAAGRVAKIGIESATDLMIAAEEFVGVDVAREPYEFPDEFLEVEVTAETFHFGGVVPI